MRIRAGRLCSFPLGAREPVSDLRLPAVTVAHSVLVICWHLLTDDRDYDDLGGDYFTRRNTDCQRDRVINSSPAWPTTSPSTRSLERPAAVDSLHSTPEVVSAADAGDPQPGCGSWTCPINTWTFQLFL